MYVDDNHVTTVPVLIQQKPAVTPKSCICQKTGQKTCPTKVQNYLHRAAGNVPPPSKSEDSSFCKTNKTHGMKVNITILSMYQN